MRALLALSGNATLSNFHGQWYVCHQALQVPGMVSNGIHSKLQLSSLRDSHLACPSLLGGCRPTLSSQGIEQTTYTHKLALVNMTELSKLMLPSSPSAFFLLSSERRKELKLDRLRNEQEQIQIIQRVCSKGKQSDNGQPQIFRIQSNNDEWLN